MQILIMIGILLMSTVTAWAKGENLKTDNQYELLMGAVKARTELCLDNNLMTKYQYDLVNEKFSKVFHENASKIKLKIDPLMVEKDTDQLKSYIRYKYETLRDFRKLCNWILEDAMDIGKERQISKTEWRENFSIISTGAEGNNKQPEQPVIDTHSKTSLETPEVSEANNDEQLSGENEKHETSENLETSANSGEPEQSQYKNEIENMENVSQTNQVSQVSMGETMTGHSSFVSPIASSD